MQSRSGTRVHPSPQADLFSRLLLVYDTTGLRSPQLHEHDSQHTIALVATSLTDLSVNVRLRPCRYPPTVNVLQIRALI